LCELEETALLLEEFQALKHADLDGREQAAGAAAMGVSRQTFGNILASARRKLADAVVNGKALKISKAQARTAAAAAERGQHGK